MRADSRQDFQAKLLALMGLGLLAAAGALVDYLPTDVRVPRPAGTLVRLPAPIKALDIPYVTAGEIMLATDVSRVTSTAEVSPAPTVISGVGANLVAEIVAPPMPAALDVAPSAFQTVPGAEVALSLPASSEVATAEPALEFSGYPSGSPASDGSFLGGAFRVAGGGIAAAGGTIVSAGDSIVSVGVKTGQSVVRAVAGAFKKIRL